MGEATFLVVVAAMIVLPIIGIVYLRPRYKRAGKRTMTPVEPVVAWFVLALLVVRTAWIAGTTVGLCALGLALVAGVWTAKRYPPART